MAFYVKGGDDWRTCRISNTQSANSAICLVAQTRRRRLYSLALYLGYLGVISIVIKLNLCWRMLIFQFCSQMFLWRLQRNFTFFPPHQKNPGLSLVGFRRLPRRRMLSRVGTRIHMQIQPVGIGLYALNGSTNMNEASNMAHKDRRDCLILSYGFISLRLESGKYFCSHR